jgi:transcription antitermination factor NusG
VPRRDQADHERRRAIACADEVIAEIQVRERNGAIELPRHKLKAGDRVKIVSGPLAGRRGRYAGESRRHVKVLLQMLGIERQVQSSKSDVSCMSLLNGLYGYREGWFV